MYYIGLNVDFTGVVLTVWGGSVVFGGRKKKKIVVVAEGEYLEVSVLQREDAERWLWGAVKLDSPL